MFNVAGYCGWYKGWHFRSLKELAFMINCIERFNFKWRSMENKSDAIPYINSEGKSKNYYPDFLLNDKFVIEIKPRTLWESKEVVNKRLAAEEFCKKNNLKYKLIDPEKLSKEEVHSLFLNNIIKFSPKYEQKYIRAHS